MIVKTSNGVRHIATKGFYSGEVADDAWQKYNEDRDFFTDDSWEWKDE